MGSFVRVWVVAAVLVALLPWPDGPAAQAAEPCPSGPVALTFDDGPHATYTPQVLDVLAGRHARATFFVVGQQVAARPELLIRTAREGHIIANHSWAHERLPGLSDSQIASTLTRTSDLIQQLTGHRPPLMRPPYGAIDGRVARVVGSVGLLPVLWDIDTSDYAGIGPDEIVRRALSQLHAGAVVLLHDGVARSGDTVAALPRIIDEARARGFCFASSTRPAECSTTRSARRGLSPTGSPGQTESAPLSRSAGPAGRRAHGPRCSCPRRRGRMP
jgi:peptidoglycan-N-acetylglucosamine deacetylase